MMSRRCSSGGCWGNRRGTRTRFYEISKDEPGAIQRALLAQLTARHDIQAIILNGGTGVSGARQHLRRRRGVTDQGAARLRRNFSDVVLSNDWFWAWCSSHATAGIIVTPPPDAATCGGVLDPRLTQMLRIWR